MTDEKTTADWIAETPNPHEAIPWLYPDGKQVVIDGVPQKISRWLDASMKARQKNG